MGEEEPSKAEAETETAPETPPTPPQPPATEELKDVEEEKPAVAPPPPPPPPPPSEVKPDDSKALSVVEKVEDAPKEQNSGGSIKRDAVLSRLATEKKLSLIKAWEDNEKTKTENKAVKKLSAIAAWENSRKAAVEAELKRIEEELEKQKAEFAEKVKNKIASLHKTAEEKRAIVVARRGEEMLRAEELAAKSRAKGLVPKKFLGCFGA